MQLEAVGAGRPQRGEPRRALGEAAARAAASRPSRISALSVLNSAILSFGIGALRHRALARRRGSRSRARRASAASRPTAPAGGGVRARAPARVRRAAASRARRADVAAVAVFAVDEIAGFSRIGGQVVELRPRRQDVLPRALAQHPQVAPLVVHERRQRLGVGGVRDRRPPPSARCGTMLAPVTPASARQRPAASSDRRRDVHAGAACRRACDSGRHAGPAHHEADLQRRLVGEEAVARSRRVRRAPRRGRRSRRPARRSTAGAPRGWRAAGPAACRSTPPRRRRAVGEARWRTARAARRDRADRRGGPTARCAVALSLGRARIEPLFDAGERVVAAALHGADRQASSPPRGLERSS